MQRETEKVRGAVLLLYQSGNRDVALRMVLEDVQEHEQMLGARHPYTVSHLDSMGMLLLDLGEFHVAREYLEKAKKNRQEVLGANHPDFGLSLSNLGLLSYHSGDLGAARRNLEQAVVILEQHPDMHPKAIVDCLNRLGLLFHDLGNMEKSHDYYQQALAMLQSRFGPEELTALEVRHNIMALFIESEAWRRAEEHGRRSLELCEYSLGSNNAQTALSLHLLGVVFYHTGRLEEARGYLERALAIRRRILPEDHPHIGFTLRSLAIVLTRSGHHERAREGYEHALKIFEKSFGREHMTIASTLHSLGSHYLSVGETDRAIELKARAMALEERALADNITMGSEVEKSFYLQTMTDTTHEAVALHTQRAPSSSLAAKLAFETVLRRKGRVLAATAENLMRVRGSLDPTSQERLRRLAVLRGTKAFLYWKVSAESAGLGEEDLDADAKAAARYARIDQLENEIKETIASLTSVDEVLRERTVPITLEFVQASLPRGSVLVEFFVYAPFDFTGPLAPRQLDGLRYIAYVLGPQGDVRHVDLGDAETIDTAARALRQALANRSQDVRRKARELDALTLGKIRPFLGKTVERLIVSPDGMLNLVPLAALVDESDSYLVENYGLSYVTSGSDLLRTAALLSREAPLLLGNIDFDSTAGDPAAEGLPDTAYREGTGFRSISLHSAQFDPLPGTAEEVTAIGDLLEVPEERLLVGAAASETALKSIRRPVILHLATHGFFLPDRNQELDVSGDPLVRASLLAEEPLLRSGLALSGFNQRQASQGADDGVLTALEVSGLDLWGTEIVVLSACETGVGSLRTGEGVFGLRRALVLAGARTQVMTLWQVADRATTDLMVSWYAQLLEGRGRAEALRRAQVRALHGEPLPNTDARLRGAALLVSPDGEDVDLRVAGTRHPYFWAGFIVSGEAGPYRPN